MNKDPTAGMLCNTVIDHTARARLAAAAPGPDPLGADALAALLRLAGNPTNEHQEVNDALRLLFELRVHQQEIEMQQEQMVMQLQLADAERDQARQRFDAAPVALLCVDIYGVVTQANRLALTLLPEPLAAGSHVLLCWPAERRPPLRAALLRAAAGERVAFQTPASLQGGPPLCWQASALVDTHGAATVLLAAWPEV